MEHGGESNISEVEEEEGEPFEANSTSCVWRSTPAKTFYVVEHDFRLDAFLFHVLFQEFRIVDSLASGKDFLATHENIEGVGVAVIVWVRHCVEGSSGGG